MKPEKIDSELLHERLRILREFNGFKQYQIAAALELERSTYSYYETGRSAPNLKTLGKLCKIYDISFNDLLGYEHLVPELNDSGIPSNQLPKNISKISLVDTLSDHEESIIIKFRMMTSSQKEQFLSSLGITAESDSNE